MLNHVPSVRPGACEAIQLGVHIRSDIFQILRQAFQIAVAEEERLPDPGPWQHTRLGAGRGCRMMGVSMGFPTQSSIKIR